MIAERLRRIVKKKESLTIGTDQTVDDLLQQFYGENAPVTESEELESVDSFFSRAQAGIEFQATLAQSLSAISIGGQTFVSLFSHGGALCAHCVSSVGSSLGGMSSFGVPGIGGGHWHGDTWHAEGHEEDKKHKANSASHHHQTKPKKGVNKIQQASRTSRKFATEHVSVSDFISSWFCANAY